MGAAKGRWMCAVLNTGIDVEAERASEAEVE